MLLFGIPSTKDAMGLESFADDGVVQQAIGALKDASQSSSSSPTSASASTRITATAVCSTSDGYLLNDETLELLARIAVSHGEAGADIVAPSGMIDGMVGAIRAALDGAGLERVAVLSYAVKYASAFYGPFRDAAEGAPAFGDRRSHQLDPANAREAMREAALDVEQGADALLVKPALGYLDVVRSRARALPRAPARRLQRERGVRDGEGGGGERLARRARGRARDPHRDPPRRSRSRGHVPREGRGSLDPVSARGRGSTTGREEALEPRSTSRSTGRTADGEATSLDRRLFMQLQAFGGARTPRRCSRRSRPRASKGCSTRTPTIPTGVALLTLSESRTRSSRSCADFLQAAPFSELEPKPELTMLGRTYAIGARAGSRRDARRAPARPRARPELRWAIWYPLRRAGSFEQLTRKEQNTILMEHGGVGMAFGRAGLGYDIRLACHGLDKLDNDFVVGLLGPELHPLSIIVQRMRKTRQTSLHLERLGPFFVGRKAWSYQSSSR